MPDSCQQLKGWIGQQLVRLCLERWEYDVWEEVRITNQGVPSARLDLVAHRNDEPYVPLEVKCQNAYIDSYGKAFNYVLNQQREGVQVQVELEQGADPETLGQPVLVLWRSPAGRLRPQQPAPDFEILRFEQVWESLNMHDTEQRTIVLNQLRDSFVHLTNGFLPENRNRFCLQQRSRNNLDNFAPNALNNLHPNQ